MDRLSGDFGHSDPLDLDAYETLSPDEGEDDIARQDPPPEIGQDERRMQVRAYNHWASLLGDRTFPSIEELEPDSLPDFGPYSVLLDFTDGIDDPAVPHIGGTLAEECGTPAGIERLSQVPSRSLLSRITDHYMQILANQAPIGFEAEFVNQRGATILYRGILLPFSSDDETIDFIYGVINWKEMADQITTDALLEEIDQALSSDNAPEPASEDVSDEDLPPIANAGMAMDDWADGPGAAFDNVSRFVETDEGEVDGDEEGTAFPTPSFGSLTGSMAESKRQPLDLSNVASVPLAYEPEAEEDAPFEHAAVPPTDFADAQAPVEPLEAFDPAPIAPEDAGLYDCLAAARECAAAARSCEDRSRTALYEAVGRAYDVSLAAAEEPDEFASLIEENGLSVQDRAPMTPVVKLVFGADYDKTRLTEYAAVLGHAHRMGLERGALSGFLKQAEGGLKGVVSAERRLRKEESGKPVDPVDGPRASLVRKLRAIEPAALDSLSAEGSEFALVMVRRMPDGSIGLLGEVPEDVPLVEKAARRLLG